jgi:hypothetical protein
MDDAGRELAPNVLAFAAVVHSGRPVCGVAVLGMIR